MSKIILFFTSIFFIYQTFKIIEVLDSITISDIMFSYHDSLILTVISIVFYIIYMFYNKIDVTLTILILLQILFYFTFKSFIILVYPIVLTISYYITLITIFNIIGIENDRQI